MRYLISAMLILVGIVHLLPLVGVLSSDRLSTLYGLPFTDPNLAILMRHRAVLFGLLAVFFIFAAFKPTFQPLAFVTGFISVISFLWLAYSVGHYNAQIARVFTADIIALVCLTIASISYFLINTKR